MLSPPPRNTSVEAIKDDGAGGTAASSGASEASTAPVKTRSPTRHRDARLSAARAREPARDRAGRLTCIPGALARALPGAHGQRAAAGPGP